VQARINEQIHAREIRVIDADGGQLGVMDVRDAMRLAASKDLDLVEIAPTANPPVCRIMDYGKFQYERKKKAQDSRKKQTHVTVKEVKMGSRTDAHDVDFKVSHIRKFLERGQRVKVSVFFRGRSITHPELGRDMLLKVFEKVKDLSNMETNPRLEGRNMSILLQPR
jgi:translation initiation factor IF-3